MGGMGAEDPPMPKFAPLPSYRARRRWSRDDARAALAAWAASGLSQADFARREGLDVQRLRAWRHKLGDVAARPFVEIVATTAALRPGERVEVVLLSGVVVRVAESVDVTALRRIVDALAARSSC